MDDIFRIDTPGVNVDEVMAEIRRRAEEKRKTGDYNRGRLSSLAHLETANLKTSDEVLDYYLKTLVAASEIDITDFEIESKTPFFGRPVVWLKKIIWKLLKFYTYRLFSQQKDYNARVALILQGMDRRYSSRLEELEKRLESRR